MTKFDKALERARGEAPGSDVPFSVMVPEEAPPPETFDTPWSIVARPPSERVRPETPAGGRVAPVDDSPVLRLHRNLAEKVVGENGTPPAVTEQFRKVAGSLHQWQLDHAGKVVMIVSAVAHEGKTLTALNLALTFSGPYQRQVLLIDCDLRRPSLHEALQLPNAPGVAEYAESDASPVPRAVAPRLAFVPGGRTSDDPVGALTSRGVAALIEHGRANFDWIVIDTPPLVAVPDASLLNDLVDGVVLVLGAGRTSYDLATRAIAAVGRDRILGVVLNTVEARDMASVDYHERYSER
jgi:capsular exopolysaccharide synthesis family protein